MKRNCSMCHMTFGNFLSTVKKISLFTAFFVLAISLIPTASYAEKANGKTPLLTLAFVSETRGQINPCAMCSVVALGGLAQRSTYLKELRKGDTPLLTIFGANEFMADNNKGKSGTNFRNKVSGKQLLSFYKTLDPDLVYLSPRAMHSFGFQEGKEPSNFVPVDDAPAIRIVERGGKRIGVVFFNEVPNPSDLKSSLATLEQAYKVGEELSKEVDLLIGVSPWGNSMEMTMLNNNKHYDVLIGGGDGNTFFRSYPGAKEPVNMIWARPEPESKSVSTLTLYEWPKSTGAKWQRGNNYDADIFVLDRSYPADFAIQKNMPKAN